LENVRLRREAFSAFPKLPTVGRDLASLKGQGRRGSFFQLLPDLKQPCPPFSEFAPKTTRTVSQNSVVRCVHVKLKSVRGKLGQADESESDPW
jgi:hypothetical protein